MSAHISKLAKVLTGKRPGTTENEPNVAIEKSATAIFGSTCVALSGATGLDGLINSAEIISPFMAGLEPDEKFFAVINVTNPEGSPLAGFSGQAAGGTGAAAEARAAKMSAILASLVRGQYPGFVFRQLDPRDTSADRRSPRFPLRCWETPAESCGRCIDPRRGADCRLSSCGIAGRRPRWFRGLRLRTEVNPRTWRALEPSWSSPR